MPTKRTRAVYEGPRFELADAMAVKRVALGEADADEQRRAFMWIVRGVLKLPDSPLDPDNTHLTYYALGMQDAAREITNYREFPPDMLKALSERRRGKQRKDADVS